MASLKLEHIYKVYPNGTKAVNDFTMDIKDQEFIVFVGPSGCGKSTTLRMIAGLEEISAGELYIGDQLVNDMEPKYRDIAMVFQNYALYPHMTVYENMAFGLTLRHIPRDVIHKKVMWAAEVLGLKEYLDRKPKAMSGGQRQRVALGRAILRQPKVMLLDEPLSNLDAKLRSQMRSEISKLHQNLKTTFIYVTHDQVEAMTLGSRVVVMKLGRIQQIDAPKNLYDYPCNKFVAGFIGTPQMNFFNVKLLRVGDDHVDIKFDEANASLNIPFIDMLKVHKHYLDGKKEVVLGIRCENLSIDEEYIKKGENLVDMKITHFEELGNETLIYGDLSMEDKGIGDSTTKVIVKAHNSNGLKHGDVIKVFFDIKKTHFFDAKTEETISPRIPSTNIFAAKIHDKKLHVLGTDTSLPSAVKLDSFEGTLSVPVKAVSIAKDGEIAAKVERIEVINDTNLAYLVSDKHTYFAYVSNKVKEGDKVAINIDLEKVTFIDHEDREVFLPLAPLDNFNASFINYRTAIENNPNEESFKVEKELRETEVSAAYDKKIADENAEFEAKLAEAQKVDVASTTKENNEKLATVIKEQKAIMMEAKAHKSLALKEAKAKHNQALKDIKDEINKIFKDRATAENEDYRHALEINKDPIARRARKELHNSVKENLPHEKQNELTKRINSEGLDYDSATSAITADYQRTAFASKSIISELKKYNKENNDPVRYLTGKHEKTLYSLEKEKNYAVHVAGLVFFMKVNDKYIILPEPISNKIIQGLGSKVFTKTFRLSIPHDAYSIAEEGLVAEIKEVVDYNGSSYYACDFEQNGEHSLIYIGVDKKHKVGDVIHFNFDITKAEIYETALNIRLY